MRVGGKEVASPRSCFPVTETETRFFPPHSRSRNRVGFRKRQGGSGPSGGVQSPSASPGSAELGWGPGGSGGLLWLQQGPARGSLCKRCHLARIPTRGPTLARAASDSP